jgi:hypothetical protein
MYYLYFINILHRVINYFIDFYVVITYRSLHWKPNGTVATRLPGKTSPEMITASAGGIDIMHKTDMVMHIDNYLGENTRRSIEKAITGTKGVLHAHFNEQRPHLMLVSYDTERTSSFEVLACMTKQQVRAERVG